MHDVLEQITNLLSKRPQGVAVDLPLCISSIAVLLFLTLNLNPWICPHSGTFIHTVSKSHCVGSTLTVNPNPKPWTKSQKD